MKTTIEILDIIDLWVEENTQEVLLTDEECTKLQSQSRSVETGVKICILKDKIIFHKAVVSTLKALKSEIIEEK